MKYTLGSLFDGSGGFPLAGSLCGITPKWAAEIEPYPIAVTRSRFPDMEHLGDISKVSGYEIEPVDIITFGSPCQDLSIAGKRAGLKHEANGDEETTRSGLFMEAARIIKEMREATNGLYPRFALWENVPGAFSSNKGEDFRVVLEELIKIVEPEAVMPSVPAKGWAHADSYIGDGWSLAYRVFDAQYWGVPQRRRRIHLVLDLGGKCAREILFEREDLRGYSAEGFRAWQRIARSVAPCADATGFDGYNGQLTGDVSAMLGVNCGMSTGRNGIVLNDQGGSRMDVTDEVTCTLRAESHHPPCVMDAPAVIPLEHHPTDSRIKIEESDSIQTLTSRMGTGGNNVPLVMSNECAPVTLKIRSGCEGGGKGVLLQENKSSTLSCNNDQTLGSFTQVVEDKAPTVVARDYKDPTAVCYCIGRDTFNQGENAKFAPTFEEELQPTLVAKGPGAIQSRYTVRQLTHTECARLQGFPDNWGEPDKKDDFTDEEYQFWLDVKNTYATINGKAVKEYTKPQMLTWYNKLHTDSSEYKMWGNGIALPPALYCMQGMVEAMRNAQ